MLECRVPAPPRRFGWVFERHPRPTPSMAISSAQFPAQLALVFGAKCFHLQPGEAFRHEYIILSPPEFKLIFPSSISSTIQSPSQDNIGSQVQVRHPKETEFQSTITKMPPAVEYLSRPSQPFDYESDPIAAMSTYARMMHSHTKQQMDAATRSARRRSPQPTGAQASLSLQSSHSSNSSRSSI